MPFAGVVPMYSNSNSNRPVLYRRTWEIPWWSHLCYLRCIVLTASSRSFLRWQRECTNTVSIFDLACFHLYYFGFLSISIRLWGNISVDAVTISGRVGTTLFGILVMSKTWVRWVLQRIDHWLIKVIFDWDMCYFTLIKPHSCNNNRSLPQPSRIRVQSALPLLR